MKTLRLCVPTCAAAAAAAYEFIIWCWFSRLFCIFISAK